MRALAAATLIALALPASAFAHANLLQRQPTYGARLASSPHAVSLHFDQGVDVFSDGIQVRSATGKLVTAGPAHSIDAQRIATVPLRLLPKGAYTVRWHVTSFEGHVLSGVYTFGVRVVPPPPTEAYGSSGPTRTEYLVRWGYFLGLALLVGGLAFRLLVIGRRATPELERRFYFITALGVVASIELGIVGFLLRARDAFQLPLGRLVYGDLSPLAQGTRFGTAFIAMTLGFALIAAILFLAWLTERPVLLWPALVFGLVLCSGLSLSGHSAVDTGSSWRTELADWVHLSAACVWVGGLVQLGFVVWPKAPELRREAFPPLLAARGRGRGAHGRRGRVPRVRAAAPGVRPLAGALRPGVAPEERARRGCPLLGRAAPFRRPPRPRARTRHGLARDLPEPARRERDRDVRPARRRGARRREPTAAAPPKQPVSAVVSPR